MTRDDRQKLRKLCEAVPPGPWRIEREDFQSGRIAYSIETKNVYGVCTTWVDDPPGPDNENRCPGKLTAEFIATARTAIPVLLEALDERDREISRVRQDERAAVWTPVRVTDAIREAVAQERERIESELESLEATVVGGLRGRTAALIRAQACAAERERCERIVEVMLRAIRRGEEDEK